MIGTGIHVEAVDLQLAVFSGIVLNILLVGLMLTHY